MIFMRSAGIIVMLVGLPCAVGLLASQPSEEKPVWHAEWRTAQRIAKQENKPIFAVLVCRH